METGAAIQRTRAARGTATNSGFQAQIVAVVRAPPTTEIARSRRRRLLPKKGNPNTKWPSFASDCALTSKRPLPGRLLGGFGGGADASATGLHGLHFGARFPILIVDEGIGCLV